jgi:hypothetical protein
MFTSCGNKDRENSKKPAADEDAPMEPATVEDETSAKPVNLRSSSRVAVLNTSSKSTPPKPVPTAKLPPGTDSSGAGRSAVAVSSTSGVSMKKSRTVQELIESRGSSKRTRALYIEGNLTTLLLRLVWGDHLSVDRKAFFAVASVLMDPTLVEEVISSIQGDGCDRETRQRLICDHMEECVLPQHRPLIEKLKQ